MRKSHLALCAALSLAAAAPLLAASEQDQVDRATRVVEKFMATPDSGIPIQVMHNAKGVAIITIVKEGFLWSGRAGDGVVVARTPQGWSGPSFIRAGGTGFEPLMNGNITDFVVILNTPEAVRAFERGGHVEIGGTLTASMGPVGRTVQMSALPKTALYTYSRTEGVFTGASLAGTVITTNHLANAHYYHRPVSARAILNSHVQAPRGAARLRATL